jgi:hypothetical protein
MKRVLVHPGYPKAASTTLQNGLFLQLHRKNAIHFLGRAFESRYYGAKANKREFKNWFKSVTKNGGAGDSLGPLSDSVLNLLSEGLFMMNERHGDKIATPKQLRDYFASKADRLEVLLIIRAQATLIPSYYVQNYRRMTQKALSDFVGYHAQENWAGEGKIFNLHDVTRAYADVLGKDNVHVALFEDLASNKDAFASALASAMDLPVNLIQDNLGASHLNQTKNDGGVVLVKKHNKGSLRHIAIQAVKMVSAGAADSLRLRLPVVSAAEQQVIFDSFKDSNLKLAEEFSLDKTRMRQYKYF